MSFGPRGHSTIQAHAITGELWVNIMPKFPSLLVPSNLPRGTTKLDRGAQTLQHGHKIHRPKIPAVREKLRPLHRDPQDPVGKSVACFGISQVLQQFILGHVPDDADMRTGGPGWAVLGEHSQSAGIPCLANDRREVSITLQNSKRRGEFRLDDHQPLVRNTVILDDRSIFSDSFLLPGADGLLSLKLVTDSPD